jgi:predicted nucleic acid-binding protein
VLLARDATAEAARRARLTAVQATFTPLLVDESVAERYGDVLAVARSERRTAKATDLLIIATAAAHGRTLHTLDERQASLARAAGVAVQAI